MSVGKLTVHLDAVAHNYRLICDKVVDGAKTMVGGVVKADAYGLGVARVAPTLFDSGCRNFFVATLDEGVELRAILASHLARSQATSSTAAPRIVILGGVDTAHHEQYVSHSLVPAIASMNQLISFRDFAVSAAVQHRVFLQIDTGMNRLGLDAEGRNELLTSCGDYFVPKLDEQEKIPGLRLDGLMTHLACSDFADISLSDTQRQRFIDFCTNLKSKFPSHCDGVVESFANSVGTFRDPKFHFEIVRPGMALYGLDPSVEGQKAEDHPLISQLRRTVTLRVPLIQIRTTPAGECVGYNATYKVKEDSKIGTLSVGYADGFIRHVSNRGANLYWKGHAVPIAGIVSMDMIACDLTSLYKMMDAGGELDGLPQEGDFLDLLCDEQPPTKLAQLAETIGYEVLTNLGKRYHRDYTGGGAV